MKMTCFLHIKLVAKQRNKQIFYLCRYTYFFLYCKVKSEINERQARAILFKDIIHVSAILAIRNIRTRKCVPIYRRWNIIDSLISIWSHWKINLTKLKKRKKIHERFAYFENANNRI